MNGTNLNDCVNASSVNMFQNKIGRYLIRASYIYHIRPSNLIW